MTEEPNALLIRFHKKKIVREDENTIIVKIDDSKKLMGPLLAALLNPDIVAVVRMDEE